MSLYRPAQQDLTVSLADNLVRPEMPDQVAEFMQKATAKPMVRRFDFASMQGMLSTSLQSDVVVANDFPHPQTSTPLKKP